MRILVDPGQPVTAGDPLIEMTDGAASNGGRTLTFVAPANGVVSRVMAA